MGRLCQGQVVAEREAWYQMTLVSERHAALFRCLLHVALLSPFLLILVCGVTRVFFGELFWASWLNGGGLWFITRILSGLY